MSKTALILGCFLIIFSIPAFAQYDFEHGIETEEQDTTYPSTITTDTGRSSGSVKFEDNQASDIQMPDYSDMSIYGVEPFNWEQTGIDSKGEEVTIDRQDSYQPDEANRYEPDAYPTYQY